jgi:ribosomal protein L32
MLTDEEWDEISTLIQLDTESIKTYRSSTGVSLKEATSVLSSQAFDRYFEMTGIRETNLNALWHHHLSLYGDECPSCGHLLRTPQASFCANCGKQKD